MNLLHVPQERMTELVYKEMTKEKCDELNSIKCEIMDWGARKISSFGHNHEEKEHEVLTVK